ncbi:MAG: PTS mannose/fructose/sorbose/N-acetylgalactosamine transporter subunit IIC [Cellulosilyticaceae bacterium]
MDFSVVQILLILIVTFVAAIDQFNFLQSLYRPIVMGPIIGLILGNFNAGLIIGASYELMMIGAMPIGGTQPPNPVIGGIMATVFGIGLGIQVDAALPLAIPFALLGQYAVTILFTACSTIMVKADQYAVDGNTHGIDQLNYITMLCLGLFFSIIVLIGLLFGQSVGNYLTTLCPQWVWNGLSAAGGMMPALGFAMLMKVMLSKKYIAFLATGFVLVAYMRLPLLVVTILGVVIAIYNFQVHTENNNGNEGADTSDGT